MSDVRRQAQDERIDRLHAKADEADAMTQEWLALLAIATEYMVAAESLIDGLQGKLGVDTRAADAREQAAAEIKRRVTAYVAAREAFGRYGRERQALLGGS